MMGRMARRDHEMMRLMVHTQRHDAEEAGSASF